MSTSSRETARMSSPLSVRFSRRLAESWAMALTRAWTAARPLPRRWGMPSRAQAFVASRSQSWLIFSKWM